MTRKSNEGKDGFKSRGDRAPRRERTGGAGGRPRPGGKPFRPSQPPGEPLRAPSPPKDADRIAKVIARAGLASRREAEAWIAAGRVAVNDRVIASPALNVTAADRITVDGAPLPARERTRLFLYHKPRGLVTTNADPEGRPTIFDSLAKNLPRLLSVGRLDIGTEGLLLLTNDGGLARVLELPETGWLRRYRVRALGRITQHDLDALRDGVTVEGIHYGPIEATLDREQGANVWLTFAIREGKNREVRNVLEHIGLQVNRLIRLSFGPFQLGDLAEGATEEVKTRALRDQLGERITAQANCDFSAPIGRKSRRRHRHAPNAPPVARRTSVPRSGAASPAIARAMAAASTSPQAGHATATSADARAGATASAPTSRPAGRAAAMRGARTMRRCAGIIAAAPMRAGARRKSTRRRSAPACSPTARAAACWSSVSARSRPSKPSSGATSVRPGKASRAGPTARAGRGPRAPAAPRIADACRRRAPARPHSCCPQRPGHSSDQRSSARVAVQHPGPCLWGSSQRGARAGSFRRHRCARHRGDLARRRLRAVRR
jgi:pseudouridine synthase